MKFPSFDPSSSLSRENLVDVYLEIRPKIERVVARRTGSHAVAADIAQEMFFKIDSIKVGFTTRVDAERYLLRVAANASLDYIKIEARRREILEQESRVGTPASMPCPERNSLAMDELRRVEDALAELPEKCRAVFTLSRFHGLSHAEISARLGVSRSLVEKYVVRALLHCRARLMA